MIRINYIGTAGGLGVTTLTVLSAKVTGGMAVERGPGSGDMAATLGVMPTPDDIFRHRFGDTEMVFADCGRTVPVGVRSWCNVLVVPRRYLGLRQVGPLLVQDFPIVGFVDVATGADVLSLADVKATLDPVPHLGTITHGPNMARVVDAGLMNTRMPALALAEATAITDSIVNLLEEHA